MNIKTITTILPTLLFMNSKAQDNFKLIVLGSGGGTDESNLSAYLLSAKNSNKFLCLDAGTLMHGLKLATKAGLFNHLDSSGNKEELPAHVLHNHIDAYAISHTHLDHITGMLIAGPFDNAKKIFCAPKTADELMNYIFLSPLWANFTTEGKGAIGKWELNRMKNNNWYAIPNNQLQIKSFDLCHSCPNTSSAFLVKNKNAYALYFGDTGADIIEGEKKLEEIFKEITPLIQKKELKAIFIEVSFPDSQKNQHLYGHLKPSLLENELEKLASFVNKENKNEALVGLKLFITHLKPNYSKENNSLPLIEEEIMKMKHFGAEIIFPKQSEKHTF